jgi:hypothetical protein
MRCGRVIEYYSTENSHIQSVASITDGKYYSYIPGPFLKPLEKLLCLMTGDTSCCSMTT